MRKSIGNFSQRQRPEIQRDQNLDVPSEDESALWRRKWSKGRGWNEEYANHVEAKKFDVAFARCKLFLRDVF